MEIPMIHSDNHVHTYFSSDSTAPMTDMIKRAIELNLDSVCFTDHMDYNFPDLGNGMTFEFNTDNYVDELLSLTAKYEDRINIRTGVELGIKPGVEEKCKKLMDNYNFDFIIASTHIVDEMDPYYPEYWSDKTEKQGIIHYHEATLDNLTIWNDFDVYGHIDYITRYTPSMKAIRSNSADANASASSSNSLSNVPGRYNNAEDYINEYLNWSTDIIEEIFKKIINNGKGIEINTAGLKYGLGHAHPHEKLLKLYHELGGEIISVGSDAHEPKHMAYDFDVACELLKNAGFRYYTEFHNRKPVFIEL